MFRLWVVTLERFGEYNRLTQLIRNGNLLSSLKILRLAHHNPMRADCIFDDSRTGRVKIAQVADVDDRTEPP